MFVIDDIKCYGDNDISDDDQDNENYDIYFTVDRKRKWRKEKRKTR